MLGVGAQNEPAPLAGGVHFQGKGQLIDLSDLLDAAIDDVVPGEAPYYVQHSPFERETMLMPPAQPPA